MTAPTTFAELALEPSLRAGLDALDYSRLTPIQAQSLPAILDGRDLIAQAPTGSGKTAAFGLGLLHAIDAASVKTQALVLCPTRELADRARRDDSCSERLTIECYFDVFTLSMQYNLDLDAALADLVAAVRRTR